MLRTHAHPARRSPRQRTRIHRGLLSTVLALSLLAMALASGLTTPAAAAGDGVLDLQVTAVDSVTGEPISEIAFGAHQDKVAYRVEFACSAAACDNTTVQLAPSPADPFGLAAVGPTAAGTNDASTGRSILTYESFTKPAGMAAASISGDDSTGKLVTLGDLAPGAAGSFLVVYTTTPRATLRTSTSPSQFYPDGFRIQMSATIGSPSATGSRSDEANDVTWRIQTPEPGVAISGVGTVKPNVPVSHQVRMGSGSIRGAADTVGAVGGNVFGFSKWIAAGSFTTVAELDPRAVYVSDSAGGVYDPDTHTVTWARGTASDPTYWAGGGWGSVSANNWNARGTYYFKPNLVLSYPSENFPDADADGCNFSATVTNTMRTSVTYLDRVAQQDRTTKTAESAASTTVACYTPFGRASIIKSASGNVALSNPRIQHVPEPGSPSTGFFWEVSARNGGNRPGVAVVTDDTLDQADARVHRIQTLTAGGTIQYELNNGTTGTATTTVDAPAGTWFVKSTVTTAPIAPVNIVPSGTSYGESLIRYHYLLGSDAPVGETRTNTASLTMTYPTEPELDGRVFSAGPSTFSVIFTKPNARFAAQFDGAPVVTGGGSAVPGSEVTFKVRGATQNVPVDKDITPQYVFVAPTGWKIQNGSASFAAGAVPDGVTFDYASRTIDGVDRDVVVASWPDHVTFGSNATWPSMSVVASPSALVAAGSTSVAHAWITDSRNNWDDTSAQFDWNSTARVDAPDVDGDSNTEEWFATISQSIGVSSADRLGVLKEVCVPDPSEADGCDWQSNPDQPVHVAPGSSDLKYRVSVVNGGNTVLGNVVAYDVLPHLGDQGISAGTAATPRGSDFPVTVAEVSNVSDGLTLAYSASTNPTRPQVHPTAVGTTNDWNATPTGKKAIRATVAGTMAPGETKSFSFTVALDPTARAGDEACNSVAADSDKTLPAEPRAVCIEVAQADLAISTDTDLPLQVGRPGTVTLDVVNHGPTDGAPANVSLDVPAGLTVTDLTPAGWSCETMFGQAAPVTGPIRLMCAPVNAQGDKRTLALDAPESIDVAVKVSSDVAEACIEARITGPLHDPIEANNRTSGCFKVAPATSGVAITKDDGREAVRPGDTTTYTVTVRNTLVAEDVIGATVTDVLPAGLTYVAATGDPTVSGQTLTWSLADLAPGEDVEFSVTVKVAQDADTSIVNTADVSAPDPAGGPGLLHDSATDSDLVRALTITKSSDARALPRVGDVVTYTVTVTNVGPDAYGQTTPITVTDDASDLFDDATYNGDATSDHGADPVVDEDLDRLTWSGPVPGNGSVTLTYSVTLAAGGDARVANRACIPAGETAVGTSACDAVVVNLPKLTIEKTASTTDLPSIGDDVTYTVTVENTSDVDFTATDPATMTDDLSDVLDDATFDPDTDASATVGEVDFVSPELTWKGPLAAGDTATITYTVTYTGEGDHVVVNRACIPAELATRGTLACATTQALGAALEVRKSVDPASGTSVRPGDELTYRIELESTGRTGAAVAVVDDLGGVLDDATLTGTVRSDHAAVSAGALGNAVLISGLLPRGETATIEYTVRVNGLDDQGDRVLNNFVGGVPAGGVCLPANALCTTNPVAYVTVDKTSDAAVHAAYGDTITYTVTVTSAGPGDFSEDSPARVEDNLADVLDDATLTGAPSADRGKVTVSAGELTWVGALASGESSTISYTVVVDRVGDLVLLNTACAPNGKGPASCASLTTPLAKIEIDKQSDPASGGEVEIGDDIAYTLTFTNVGPGAGQIQHTDHLADVLDDADLTRGPSSRSATAALVTPETIAVTGEIAGQSTSTVTYSVRVNGDGDGRLENFLVRTGTVPPRACLAATNTADTACTVSTVAERDETGGEAGDENDSAGGRDDSPLPSTGGPATLAMLLAAALSVGTGIMLLRRRVRVRS